MPLYQRFDSKYLWFRIFTRSPEDTINTPESIIITVNTEGARHLQSLVLAPSREQFSWKVSPEFVFGSLCEELNSDETKLVEKFIDIKDKEVIEKIVYDLYWDAQVEFTVNDINDEDNKNNKE